MEARRFNLSTIPEESIEQWRARSESIVKEFVARWNLRLLKEFTGGVAGRAFGARTLDDQDVVLKVAYPHAEAVAEAIASATWAPRWSPAVLQQDVRAWTFLLERVRPGMPLRDANLPLREAVAVAADLLRGIRGVAVPEGIPSLAEIVTPWPDRVRSVVSERAAVSSQALHAREVHAWLDLADELVATDRAGGFVHGDANPGNVLSSDTGWRFIDAKPMRGDLEFDLGPLLEQVAPVSAENVRAGLHVAVDILDVSLDRAIAWGGARAALNVAWAWQDGDDAAASQALVALRAWQELRSDGLGPA